MRLSTTDITVELEAIRIVHQVRLSVEKGEIVGLIGPNGSGKSTFLRTVYRMLRPISGRVTLGGDDVWRLSARRAARRTGVVVQEGPVDFELTVREMVQMGRTPHKGVFARDNKKDEAIVENALKRVSMTDFADRPFPNLSGGEKQRTLIARALAQQPKLLVLDEPTNHLDIHYQMEILELVKKLGITTLITLHDMNLAAAYCQRLYALFNGRIAAHGDPEKVLTPALLRKVFQVDAVVGIHPVTGRPHLAFLPLSREKIQ